MPYLALGSDAGLKAVALKELRGAASADEQAAIGRHVVGLGAGQAGRGAGRVAAPGRRLVSAGRAATVRWPGGSEGQTAFGGSCEARPGDPHALPRPRRLRRPAAGHRPVRRDESQEHQAAWAKYLGVPVEMTNSIGMKFVLIPPGEFDMGSTEAEVAKLLEEAKATKQPSWYIERLPAEAPKHRVRITKPFWLGRHEVTRGQFRRFVDDRGYQTEAERDGKGGYGLVDGQWKQDPRFVWNRDLGFEQADDHPVVNVTLERCDGVLRVVVGEGRREVALAERGAVGVRLPGGDHDDVVFG